MSDPPFDPFQGLPFLGDLARMVAGQGPLNWDAARHLALTVATGGEPEANVDPIDRLAYEAVARVAELHVTAATGLGSGLTRVTPVTASTWTTRSLEAYRPLFERLAAALSGAKAEPGVDPELAMLSGLLQMLTPVTLGMSAGSMVGHLARRSFGQYHLPIPRPPSDELLVLPSVVSRFADDWSIPLDDLRLYVCLHELTHHAVMSVPHVRSELDTLVSAYVSGFRPNPNALEERLGGLDQSDMSLTGLQQFFNDPEVLLGAMGSDAHRSIGPQLNALVSLLVGYVDHVLDVVGAGLISSYATLSEAVRRDRLVTEEAELFVARLFGVSLGQEQVTRGRSFIGGVIERAGGDALSRLWEPGALPTPAEMNAPGLWLARIDLPE